MQKQQKLAANVKVVAASTMIFEANMQTTVGH